MSLFGIKPIDGVVDMDIDIEGDITANRVCLADGSAANPSICFQSETGTGLWKDSLSTMGQGKDIIVGGKITATTGDIVAANGDVVALAGDVTVSSGNVVTVVGKMITDVGVENSSDPSAKYGFLSDACVIQAPGADILLTSEGTADGNIVMAHGSGAIQDTLGHNKIRLVPSGNMLLETTIANDIIVKPFSGDIVLESKNNIDLKVGDVRVTDGDVLVQTGLISTPSLQFTGSTGTLSAYYSQIFATTMTTNSSSPITSASVNLCLERIGDTVTIHWPQVNFTIVQEPNTFTRLQADTVLPIEFRPSIVIQGAPFVTRENNLLTEWGRCQVLTDGTINFYRDFVLTAWSTGTRGIEAGTASWSCV
jgi:hypothetical protein